MDDDFADDDFADDDFADDEHPDDPEENPPMTPLVRAIQFGEPLDVVQDILKRSPELMQQPMFGMYPLSHAVWIGSPVEVVRALHRCWPESVRAADGGPDGFLPLHSVRNMTPVETVEFLVDAYPEALKVEVTEGLPIHTSINRQAPRNAVRVLVERHPESLLVQNFLGLLPIHLAVFNGDVELVTYLADRCPESLRVFGGDSDLGPARLAIHVVAESTGPHRLRIIQLLTNRFPESLGVATKDEELPIHLAARTGGEQQLDVIEFLADRNPESLRATTAHGHLPVHLALLSRSGTRRIQADVIQRLAVEAIPEGTRLRLMHFLVREVERLKLPGREHPRLLLDNVSALAEALPATLRAEDSVASLPIHAALRLKVPYVVMDLAERLVAQDPESLLHRNAAGELPLHACSHKKVAQFLFESCPQAALVAGRDGNLPIHTALTKLWFQLAKSIVELCPRGSQGLGARGRTPMHVVAALPCRCRDTAHDVLDVAEHLVRSWPASLLVGDDDGNLPIHVALARRTDDDDGAYELVRGLIDCSPESLRVPGACGRMPLHVAVARSFPSPALVQLLVDGWSGALDARDASGNLPLQLAHANRTSPLTVIYCLVRASPHLFGGGSS